MSDYEFSDGEYWEYGVEYTEPLNGDREIALFPTLAKAREYMAEDTTSGNWGHRLIGRRIPVRVNEWEPVPHDDTP